MDANPNQTAAEPPASALPHSHVLSYVASAESPTRVRLIAARVLKILGIVHGVAGLGAMAMIVWWALEVYRDYYGLPAGLRLGPSIYLRRALEDGPAGWVVLLLYAATIATVLLACARPVGRGRKAACYISVLGVVPLMLMSILAACGFAANAVVMGTPLGGFDWNPVYLILLLPFGLCVLGFLLLWDLTGFLRWIANHPITEKPPVAFLPSLEKAD
jgi:amino acid transporter